MPFFTLLKLIIIEDTHQPNLQCSKSTDCEDNGFCNFENGKSGNCESCEDFRYPEKDCTESGFSNVKGEDECKSICKPGK